MLRQSYGRNYLVIAHGLMHLSVSAGQALANSMSVGKKYPLSKTVVRQTLAFVLQGNRDAIRHWVGIRHAGHPQGQNFHMPIRAIKAYSTIF